MGCSPWDREELDTTKRLHFRFSLSCTGEGSGNALQCSCLENARDGGAWWAAVFGVAQSRTRLKRLSSSSSKDVLLPLLSHSIPEILAEQLGKKKLKGTPTKKEEATLSICGLIMALYRASLIVQLVQNLPAVQETPV